MKSKEIYEFEDYKAYLRHWLDHAPRGSLSRLARAAGCQASFFSQVLTRKVHLSQEQAWLMSKEMGLENLEARYFFKLIDLGRSQAPNYREHSLQELRKIKADRHNLQERFPVSDFLSEDEKSVYFSSYLYTAIHLLSEIKNLSNKESMAKYLQVSEARVSAVADDLIRFGLISRTNKGYAIGKRRLHIASDSNLIIRHHTNWRLRALAAIEGRSKEALHYSSVITLSEEDIVHLKNLLVEFIGQLGKTVAQTTSERCYVFNADFFELGGR